jgi:iron complex transport system permease protein
MHPGRSAVPRTPIETRPGHLDVDAPRRRTLTWTILLVVALTLTMLVGIAVGPVPVAPAAIIEVLSHALWGTPTTATAAETSIVLDVRAPRVLLGAAVGAALAVSGATLQAMVRNPLADPYVLGISGGASTGAAAALLFGIGAGLGQQALPVSAFVGALAAGAIVLAIATTAGRVTSVTLLLSGVAVGYALSAVTSFLVFASGSAEGTRSVMFWLLGSLSLARWDLILATALAVAVTATILLTATGRTLDVLTTGDETMHSLGYSASRVRVWLLVVVSLCTGVAVAAAGSIGFVGLVVPHLARRAVGSLHARMIPVSALLGAVLLLWADLASRTLMAPRELPIGIVTAMIGAPFLLALVRRAKPSRTS